MFKFILDRLYPDAPAPYSPREIVQRAIIEALVGHLYRLGYSVDEVRVPASLVANETVQFVSTWGQFHVASGLDAYGDNVITSALTGSNATNATTASASVTADTVAKKYIIEKSGDVEPVLSALKKLDEAAEGGSTALTEEEFRALGRVRVLNEARPDTVTASSDDDLVKLVGETIIDVLEAHSWCSGDRTLKSWGGFYGDDKWEGQLDFTKIATAVLGKLRSAGVIR